MRRLLGIGALLLAFAATSYAQGVQTGTLRGIVKDQQGLAVPGATVTVTSPALQGLRTAVSGPEGAFTFQFLPPGVYEVKVELEGFATLAKTMNVPLGGVAEQSFTLQAGGITEQVQVVGEKPAPITTPVVGENFKQVEIESLANQRTLQGIAQLAPGLTENTPNGGQLQINGAFAFDNVFMLNGVDLNDNLFGSPQNLFIEDAIQETQVLTSGISAEYGRFTGGVVNAITKSGGNSFSGSMRVNFENPAWTDETPYEVKNNITRKDTLQQSFEGTIGGPILKDKIWFFGAGRYSKLDNPITLAQTGKSTISNDLNRRGEVKVTATPFQNHTFQVGYNNNYRERTNHSGLLSYIIDPRGLVSRVNPNTYYFANYRSTLKNNLLFEAQYSQRNFEFKGEGGTSTNILDSPIWTINQAAGVYNAPYFDATDPEQRNNRQFTGSMTYYLSNAAGRHEIKSGYEFFRSQRTGGNSQSSTSYVFDSDYLADANGNPIYDANGRLQPVFNPGESYIEYWPATRGAVMNVDTQSAYVQDHWAINSKLSADVGTRFEKVLVKSTPGDIISADGYRFVPRLAAAYDLRGDGDHIIHVTYAWYSGRYNEAQIGANSPVGNPASIISWYDGPAGVGMNFASGFDPKNYPTVPGNVSASVPTANIFMDPNVKSALLKEFSASYGANLFAGRGYAEVAYIHRNTSSVVEDFVTLAGGTTHVVYAGVDAGTVTNIWYRNTDLGYRKYDGLVFQSRYRINDRWSVNGHYTLMLRDWGNYEGEGTNTPGATSVIGNYPEAFNATRSYPDGNLDDFQRSRLRLWTIYNLGLGRAGDMSISGLLRVDSATTYSLRATSQAISTVQKQILSNAGYPDLPANQTIYFGERGDQFFKGYGLIDTSINYNIPVWGSLKPWLKFDVYNLLNNQKLISWNTSISRDPNSPKDNLGLATGYIKGAKFGQADRVGNFPLPFGGTNGGRTFRVAVGFRF